MYIECLRVVCPSWCDDGATSSWVVQGMQQQVPSNDKASREYYLLIHSEGYEHHLQRFS